MNDAERRPFSFASDRLRRGVRWGAIGLALLGLVYLALSVALQVVLDADYLEERINRALNRSTEGVYRVDIEAVHWSLWRRSLQAEHIRLHPDPERLQRGQEAGRHPAGRYRVTVPELRLQGIHLWPLLWRRDLQLDTFTFQNPHVQVNMEGSAQVNAKSNADDHPANRPDTSASSDRAARSVHAALARQLPGVDARRLMVEEGTFSILRRSGGLPAVLWGISVQLDDLAIDSTSARDTSRVLFSNHVTVTLDGYRGVFEDSLYAVTVGPAHVSTRDSLLTVQSFHVGPTVSDPRFMQRQRYRTNRYISSARRIEVRGLEARRFVEERSLLAGAASIDSLVVDVYRNNHLPRDPNDPPPPMPHKAARGLRQVFRIDTIRVRGGTIRYTRLAEDGAQPGAIAFEDVSASMYNVTNDPRRMTRATPAVVDAIGWVAGAGRLQTTIRLPLLSPHLSLTYHGRLGPMDARALNDAFVNIAGVRIESGDIDSLWFAADVQRGIAAGTLQGVYRNLEVETLDKATGERGLKKRIGTFVLNTLAMKSRNTWEDGSLRTGTIDHVYEEGDSFFKFLWHSVRSGIFSMVGL